MVGVIVRHAHLTGGSAKGRGVSPGAGRRKRRRRRRRRPRGTGREARAQGARGGAPAGGRSGSGGGRPTAADSCRSSCCTRARWLCCSPGEGRAPSPKFAVAPCRTCRCSRRRRRTFGSGAWSRACAARQTPLRRSSNASSPHPPPMLTTLAPPQRAPAASAGMGAAMTSTRKTGRPRRRWTARSSTISSESAGAASPAAPAARSPPSDVSGKIRARGVQSAPQNIAAAPAVVVERGLLSSGMLSVDWAPAPQLLLSASMRPRERRPPLRERKFTAYIHEGLGRRTPRGVHRGGLVARHRGHRMHQ